MGVTVFADMVKLQCTGIGETTSNTYPAVERKDFGT